MNTIISWCSGDTCDPCKPPAGNMYIAGITNVPGYIGQEVVAVNWTTWDWAAWTPITVLVTITASGDAASGSTTIKATVYFSGGGSTSWIPLPLTAFGSCQDVTKVVYLHGEATAPGGTPQFQYGGIFGALPLYILNKDGTQTPVPYMSI